MNKFTFIAIFLFGFFSVGGQVNVEGLIDEIERSALKKGILGISVHNVKGEQVFQHQSHLPLVPASVWKVATAYYALETLGPSFRYKTQLGIKGELVDGILEGNVVIHGGGDPSLASPNYGKRKVTSLVDSWVEKLHKEGIGCIEGSIAMDLSLFGHEVMCPSWPWNDIGNYYAPGTWSFNIHENFTTLHFALSTSTETPPRLEKISPEIGVRYINLLETGPKGSGDQAYIFGAPYQSQRLIRGSLPAEGGRFKIKGSLPDPPGYFISEFLKACTKKGIEVKGEVSRSYKKIESEKVLDVVESDPLISLLPYALRKSNNLYFESFLRISSRSDPSYKGAVKRFENFFTEKNIDVNASIHDGSGMSPLNRVSANSLNIILGEFQKAYNIRKLLPMVSKSSMARYVEKPLHDKIWIKTGYMTGVRSITGILERGNGEVLLFSMIYNGSDRKDAEIRKLMGSLLESLAEGI